jgi:hypothetical protein
MIGYKTLRVIAYVAFFVGSAVLLYLNLTDRE